MAAQAEGGGKDDVKTQFITREGTYKVMTLSEYSRPNRLPYQSQGGNNTPVHVSFITLNDQSGTGDRICFNVGRELYFYMYKGVRKAADLTKPIDKRVYKGTFPTCHDFNLLTATAESVMLLVGFTAGQVQLIDPIQKEISKLYNEERLIDKTKVTCIKWLPGSPNQFMVSHSSGQMYVYNEELICGATPPHYQLFKQGDGFSVYTCKTKSTRNPLYRWVVGEGAINQFEFSPCCKYLAVVSQDGYLRVFNFDTMELVGLMKSYFGGLLCVCWSPDGKYVAMGGEDDLVSVWSFHENRAVCRGKGHKSWVNAVSFDPYTTSLGDTEFDFSGSDEDFLHMSRSNHSLLRDSALRDSLRSSNSSKNNSKRDSCDSKSLTGMTFYRFASVGQDAILCLWDLTEDILRHPMTRPRTSTFNHSSGDSPNMRSNSLPPTPMQNSVGRLTPDSNSHSNASSMTNKFATLTFGERKDSEHKKEHKKNFSLGSKSGDKMNFMKSNYVKPSDAFVQTLGTPQCPRICDVPMLEPLVCKKIAHERLTSLVFKEDCLITACHEGCVCTWARPGKVGLTQQTAMSPSSPTPGGTVV